MNESAKPLIIKIIFLLVVVTSMVLVSIGLRFKYEELMREKSELNNMLREERTKKVNLIADYQAYSSEEKIISVAENKLGMVRRTQPKVTITVDKNLIKKANEKLKSKYE
ncbi:MAG: FtsL-like putative cell division protein [Ignavibacteriaceae bacterium]|jgi:cell division protein FtsL